MISRLYFENLKRTWLLLGSDLTLFTALRLLLQQRNATDLSMLGWRSDGCSVEKMLLLQTLVLLDL